MTRFIFVTGGVVSSLGKGILPASLAAQLEARDLRVNVLKMDPYMAKSLSPPMVLRRI